MITPGDDYPLHQTSRPVRDTGTDPNTYDRFFFNGYDRDATTYFACALGVYPGRNVMDGAFAVIVDGVQHNVLGSRLLGADRLDTEVGPLRVEIVEPLRRLRVVVSDTGPDGSGVAADLLFTARSPAFEEAPYRWGPGLRPVLDYTRLTQNGTWSGTITAGGRTVSVSPSGWWGTRDRSWGSRPLGGQGAAPSAPDGPLGFYWLWAPVQFEDASYLWDRNETPAGEQWHTEALWAPVAAPDPLTAPVESGTARYQRTYKAGTRHAASFALDFEFPSGRRRLDFEPVFPFAMRGIGYTHPTCAHGVYQGPLAVTRETYVTAEIDETNPSFQHIQTLCRVRRDDGVSGIGILEQLIFGPHAPSGLNGLLDMHPEPE